MVGGKVGALGRGKQADGCWRKVGALGRIPLTAPGSNPVITPENGLSLSLSHTRSQNHAHT